MLLLCGAIAPPVLVVFLISAALVTPGYSHLSETVSQLGVRGRPHPEVINAGFIVYGLLINGFAYGLYRQLRRHRGAKTIWLLLAISGVGILLSGIVHADWEGLDAATTLEGTVHSVFAQVAFFAFAIQIIVFARIVYLKPVWRGFTQLSVAIVVVDLVLSLMFLMEVSRSVEGALQRSFLGLSLVWVEAVSLRSLRLPSGADSPESPRL